MGCVTNTEKGVALRVLREREREEREREKREIEREREREREREKLGVLTERGCVTGGRNGYQLQRFYRNVQCTWEESNS